MPGDFLIELDEAGLHDLLNSPHSTVVLKMLDRVGVIVKQAARIRVPILTGNLYDKMEYHVGDDATSAYVIIGTDFYDRFLEKPAKQIPRARRTLRNAVRTIPKLL